MNRGSHAISQSGARPKVEHIAPFPSADWKAAYAHALDAQRPVLIRLSNYCDDRGWSLMNLFTGVLSDEGQINFSVQNPGVVKAWHRHQHQTDFWLCLHGHIRVGVYCEQTNSAWQEVIGEKNFAVAIIPPTLWHGAATIGPEPAGLMYYVTRAYDAANPDEERRAWDSVPGFPWEVQAR